MKSVKSANDMNLKEMRRFVFVTALPIMLLTLFFNAMIIKDDIAFVWISKVLIIVSIILTSGILLCVMFNKLVLLASYIGTAINGSVFVLSLYLAISARLDFVSILSQILVVINFILIATILVVKRIVIKNDTYIMSIRKRKHAKYIRRDSIFCLITSAIILTFAKFVSKGENLLEMDKILPSIILLAVSIIGLVFDVTGLANYVYTQRGRTKKR